MLVDELSGREDADLMRYAAVRLAFNLVYKDAAMGLRVALAEERRECPLTRHVASMLADEARFLPFLAFGPQLNNPIELPSHKAGLCEARPEGALSVFSVMF